MTCESEPASEGTRPAALALSQETVAMIAHELRSPLSVMSNVLKVCRTSIVPTAMPAAGDVLDRQVSRALRLVNDLMDLTRISKEFLRFDRARVDLGRVVLNATQDLEQQVRARRQALVLEFSAEPLWVQGDASRLEQVVGNLVENSCKYSPDGRRIVLTLSREGSQAVLCIRDDGDGISPEDLPHIFEPYFRGNSSTHASRTGLGLGLTLTRRLVELHGGTIEARSRGTGHGSEFTVRLPAAAGSR